MRPYKVILKKIVRHIDFLSDTNSCYDSWVLGKGLYSVGWLEEIESLASCGFFNRFLKDLDHYNFSKEFKEKLRTFIPEFDRYLIKVHDELKYKDLEFLQRPEWPKYAGELAEIAKMIREAEPSVMTEDI